MAASAYGKADEDQEAGDLEGEARAPPIIETRAVVIPKAFARPLPLAGIAVLCGLVLVTVQNSAAAASNSAALSNFMHAGEVASQEPAVGEAIPETLASPPRQMQRPKNREHRHLIDPFFRYSGFDCQKKGGMLAAYPPPQTAIEVGAHDGKEWEELFSVAKQIWSLEPSPDKQAQLQGVLKQHKDKGRSIELFQLAMGSDTKPMKFWVDGKNSQQNTLGKPPPWVSQERFDKGAITVQVTTLDDFWKNQCQRKHITMLKIDTQGHEPAILMSGPELFAQDPPDIIHMEYSPNLIKKAGLDGVKLLEFLYSFGYICGDCAAFTPPEVAPEKRTFEGFTAAFGSFNYKGADHGQWTDLVCRI